MGFGNFLESIGENIRSTAQGLMVLAKGEGTVTKDYGGIAAIAAPAKADLPVDSSGRPKTTGFMSVLRAIGSNISKVVTKAVNYGGEVTSKIAGGTGAAIFKMIWPLLIGLVIIGLIMFVFK